MPELPRRKFLSSLTVIPALGALTSTAAAQGVYGFGAPPKSSAAPPGGPGAPHKYPTSCPVENPSPAANRALPPPTPQMLLEQSRVARERMRQRHFPDVVLLNQYGTRVRYYTDLLKDKVVMLNFFYTHCQGECPRVNANLEQVYKLLGNHMGHDFFMYSISLKPDEDSVSVIREYARKFHAGPGWMFLTGKEDDIEQVRRGMGFVNSDPVLDKDKSQHIGNVCYGIEPLMLWGGHPGMTHPTWLVNEINSLIRAEVMKPA